MTKLWRRLAAYDWFALGPAVLAFYAADFFLVPVLALLGVRIGFALEGYEFSLRPLLIALLGGAALAAGYWLLPFRTFAARLPNPWRGPWHKGRAKFVFLAIFGTGLAVKVIKVLAGGFSLVLPSPSFIAHPFYSTVGFLDQVNIFAIALAAAFALRPPADDPKEARFWRIASQVAILTEVAYNFPTCTRTAVVIPLLVWIIAEWYLGKRSYKPILAFAVAMWFIFSWGSVCRNPLGLRSYKVLDSSLEVHVEHLPTFVTDNVVGRFNQMRVLDPISRDVVPRRGFAFLENVLVSMGPPRFLWHSKPAINADGHVLGVRLGALAPSDTVTTIGATWVGDWYLAFGIWSVVIGMFLTGGVLRLTYEYFISATLRAATAVGAYAALWVFVLRSVETSLAPAIAGNLKLFIAMFLIALFAREWRRTPKA